MLARHSVMRLAPVLLSSLVLLRQQPPQSTFRSGIDIVEAEATVVDADGQPVPGLVVADLSLVVDGKPRAIASVTYVSDSVDAESVSTGRPSPKASEHSAESGRLILFVVDEGNISFGGARRATASAARLLDTLRPRDRVALASIPSGPLVDFTTTHEQVRAALVRVVGRSSRSHGYFSIELSELFAFDVGAGPAERSLQRQVVDRECQRGHNTSCQMEVQAEAEHRLQEIKERTQASVVALSGLLKALGGVRGPKTLILISEGLAMTPGGRDLPIISSLAAQAAASRVTIDSMLLDTDSVDVAESQASPSISRDRMVEESGLLDLTSLSGGALFRVVGTADRAFERLARELSGHYLVTFQVLPGDRDGKPHRIALTTSRRGAMIHARAQFVVKPDTGESDPRLLRDVLASPFHANSLSLRAQTYTIRDTDPSKVRVLLSVDVLDAAPSVSKTSIAYQLMGAGKVVQRDARTITLDRGLDGAAQPVSWIAFRGLAPGTYALQLSASAGGDQIGSLKRTVDARLHAVGPYAVSDVFVAPSAPAGGGPFPVPAEVSVDRDELIAGIEVYTRKPDDSSQIAVRFEITRPDSRLPLASAAPILTQSGGADRLFARSTMSVADLPAGDYVVHALIVVGGANIGSVSRPFWRTVQR
jgi:VWFA-related protein